MDDLFQNPAATGLAGAVGTAFLGWLGQRLIGRAALETALRETAKEMLAQLRQELKVALKERDAARAESEDKDAVIQELRRTIHALEARLGSKQPAG